MPQVQIFSVEIGGVQRSIESIDQLKAAVLEAKKASEGGIIGSKEQAAAQKTLALLTKTQTDYTNQTRQLVKEKQSEDQTYRGLSARLNVLRDSYKDLVVQNKANTVEAKSLLATITKLDNQLKSVDASIGVHHRNIGNYASAFGSLGDELGRIGLNFAASFGISSVTDLVSTGIRKVITLQSEFQDELKKLSSLTGVTVADLDALGDRAIEMSKRFGTSAKEILEGFSLVGGAAPELLKDADALAEVTKQAEILSKAGGLTLSEAITSLVNSMNQFGVSAEDAAKFTDILSTSQQLGTARVDQLSESLVNVGGAARAVGLDFEQTNVLLQALAKGGTLGAEAGTQLRSALLKLATSGKDELNPALHSMSEILETLATEYTDVSELEKIFGERSIQTVLTLVNQRNVVTDLTGKLNDLGNAQDQANTNTDTATTAGNRFVRSLEAQVIKGSEANDIYTALLNGLTLLSETHAKTTTSQRALILTTGGLSEAFKFLWKSIRGEGGDNGAAKSAELMDKLNESVKNLDAVWEDVNRQTAIQNELQKEQDKILQKDTLGGLRIQQQALQTSLEGLVPATTEYIKVQKELEAITSKIASATQTGTKANKATEKSRKDDAADKRKALEAAIKSAQEQVALFEAKNPTLIGPDTELNDQLIDAEIERINRLSIEKQKVLDAQLENGLISITAHETAIRKLDQETAKQELDLGKRIIDQSIKNLELELQHAKLSSRSHVEGVEELTAELVAAEKKRLQDLVTLEENHLDELVRLGEISAEEAANAKLKIHNEFIDAKNKLDDEYEEEQDERRKEQLAKEEALADASLKLLREKQEERIELLKELADNTAQLASDGQSAREEQEIAAAKQRQSQGLATEEETQKKIEEIREKYDRRRDGIDGLQAGLIDLANNKLIFDLKRDQLEEQYEEQLKLAAGNEAKIAQIQKEYADARVKINEDEQNAKLAYTGQIIGAIGLLFGKETVAAKIAAVAQGTINAYLSALNTFKTLSAVAPPPFPQIAAGIVLAAALKQVSAIKAVKAEKGVTIDKDGRTSTTFKEGPIEGPSHKQGGVKGLIHGIPVEAEGGESFYIDKQGRGIIVNESQKEALVRLAIKSMHRNADSYSNFSRLTTSAHARTETGFFHAQAGFVGPRPEGLLSNLGAEKPLTRQEILEVMMEGTLRGSLAGSSKGITEANREALRQQRFRETHTL